MKKVSCLETKEKIRWKTEMFSKQISILHFEWNGIK